MCQNFSWLGWFGHELEQQGAGRQRAGNFRNAVRTLCVENGCKPIKGQSKTTKTFFCQLIHKNYLLATELGQMLNQENFRSPIIQCRRNWFIFFVMEVFPEKMWSDWILENQRSSSGSFCIFSTLVWRKVEEQHGRRRTQEKISVLFSFFRIFCISELSKVIQDATSMVLLVPDNVFIPDGFFENIYHVGCAISLHSIINSDWYQEDKIWTTDRQCSFCLWIPETRVTRTLIRSTWVIRVMHNTCLKHGRNIRTQLYWVDINLGIRKIKNSIRHDRTLSFFMKRSPLIVSRKLFGWSLAKSYTKKYMRMRWPRRCPWHIWAHLGP